MLIVFELRGGKATQAFYYLRDADQLVQRVLVAQLGDDVLIGEALGPKSWVLTSVTYFTTQLSSCPV